MSNASTRLAAFRPDRRVPLQVAFLASAVVLLLSMLGYTQWSGYREAIHDTELTTRNLVDIIESRVHRDFDRIQNTLGFIAHDLRPEQLRQGAVAANQAEVSARLARLSENFHEVAILNVFDADGLLLYSSRPETPRFSIADRPFFKPLRDNPATSLLFSDAQVSRSSGRWALVAVYAIRDAANKFLGVASAVMHLDEYDSLFGNIDVGPSGVVLLRRTDNSQLVFRFPRGNEQDFNQPLPAGNPIRQRIDAGERSGTLAYTASTDGARRLASFTRLEHYPFYIQVAQAESHYLAGWRSQAVTAAMLAALLVPGFGFAIARIIRTEKEASAAAAQLAEGKQRMELALRGGNLGFWDWHVPSGRVIFNERWCSILGYAPDEIKPHIDSWGVLVHPDDWPQIHAALEPHLRGETPAYECEHRMRHKDGHWVWILDRGLVVERDANGAAIRAVGTHLDISERKQSDEALRENTTALLRSNAELEQFSYSISHDMRQPLRMISSYLQLLQADLGGQLNDEQREYIHFAVDGAQRLDKMLLGLLEYSRVGRKGEPPTWVDSRELLDMALLFLKPLIAEADADVRIEGDWPRLFVSPDELLRLLQNLVGNAIKFRVAGRKPAIVIQGHLRDAWWICCVADNGVGILPNQTDRLFQVFQRLQSRANYEGTGIGLAVCRKIVEHHGGTIRAESPGENQGSTFCFELPLQQEAP